MTDKTDFRGPLRVADLKSSREVPFEIVPGPDDLKEIADRFELLSLRKLRFTGALHPAAASDWRIEAHLGATVVQPCVATLDPVTTRIDEDVAWSLVRDWQSEAPDADDIEMPEDETRQPLEDEIDLWAMMEEALALFVPAYPRTAEAPSDTARAAPPGVAPIRDEDVKPFAGLAALKKRLEGDATDND